MEGFDWDEGNKLKNWLKHKVSVKEAESVFQDQKAIFAKDPKHSELEQRYSVIGRSKKDRKLIIFFTVRSKNIRIISARDQSKKEKLAYEKIKQKI